MNILIDALWNQPCFSPLDRRFADFLYGLDGTGNSFLKLGALLVSSRTARGDICIEITRIGGMEAEELLREYEIYGDVNALPSMKLPASGKWLKELKKSTCVVSSGEYGPLVLDDDGRLYLYRYREYQQQIYENIRARAGQRNTDVDTISLRHGIDRLFPSGDAGETDWQRVAVYAAVRSRAAVISGGPGTGKTSTVGKILVLLIEQGLKAGKVPAIALAAPTGKAAARMKEALTGSLKTMDIDPAVFDAIPKEASTIHRLLGSVPDSPYFRHNADNPLPWDLVVVDESSMADIALIAKLLTALREDAGIILLGDKDQLASVEAGAVLGDLCDTGNIHGYSAEFVKSAEEAAGTSIPPGRQREGEPVIAEALVVLEKSYRFGGTSGIGELSRAIQRGSAAEAVRLLREGTRGDIMLNDSAHGKGFTDYLTETIADRYGPLLASKSPEEALLLFSSFTVLCALRRGPFGVERINELIERILVERGFIDPHEPWYHRRPVMITRNCYELNLFNGDMGVVFGSPEGKKVFFPSGEGGVRGINPSRLSGYETTYAMTVHKSQGSEYDHVLLILPDRPSPVLTRELLYTAVTRARSTVEIWGTPDIVREMIAAPTKRKSGLRDLLWNEQGGTDE
ncbi:MAG TPA: exodeoxyribonuclease V subunit alpha [Spirochaetota bacterium]|nr:exodeoxyribonuclease V subunit alpha [Spirochaetota bacterium]